MLRRSLSVVVIGVALFASACGSSNEPDAISEDLTPGGTVHPPGDTGTKVGSIGDAVEVAAGAPAEADDSVCVIDLQTLTTASDAYFATNGAEPTSQNDLLDAGLIMELSPRYEITAEGAIVPAPGSPCT
jgi:hypothetical protein